MTDQTERDRHLFGPGPKRILALDGGGVRGALSVAFLERIEALLDARAGRPVLLCDYFDLIGGTSTGAVIAGFLALGHRTAAIRTAYLDLASVIFKRSFWRVEGVRAKFDAAVLSAQLALQLGERTLDSADLRTGVALVTKRLDTGSPWIISNNPRAPFWETPADGRYIGNRHYRLARLVRASTAAPHFFDPEILPIADGEPEGIFVDGGLTPHNNPSLALLQLARAERFGIAWPLGAERLTVISIGTGALRKRLTMAQLHRTPPIGLAIDALTGMIDDAGRHVLAMMQALGECPAPWPINAEIGTLAGAFVHEAPLFRFLRYDAVMDAEWLARELGLTFAPEALERAAHFDDPSIAAMMYEIGCRAAALQVRDDHLPALLGETG